MDISSLSGYTGRSENRDVCEQMAAYLNVHRYNLRAAKELRYGPGFQIRRRLVESPAASWGMTLFNHTLE